MSPQSNCTKFTIQIFTKNYTLMEKFALENVLTEFISFTYFLLSGYTLLKAGADWPYNEVGKIPRGSRLGAPKAIGGPSAS
jgi:hypothetical protein